jgi:hypothetical protein
MRTLLPKLALLNQRHTMAGLRQIPRRETANHTAANHYRVLSTTHR